MKITTRQELTAEEQKNLFLLLQEAKARGINLEKYAKKPIKLRNRWNVDSRGYFIKDDGTFYNPNEKQANFIASKSPFVSFKGGRGCVSAETLINGVPIADINYYGIAKSVSGWSIFSPPYLKGVAPLYRVKTAMGGEVEVTEQHRFLTLGGWLPLMQVQVGDLILSDETWYAEMGKKREPNSLDYYSHGFRLYDELRILSEQVALNILRQPHMTGDGNSALVNFCLPSIEDFLPLLLFRFFLEYSISLVSVSQLRHEFQDFLQSHYIPLRLSIEKQFRFCRGGLNNVLYDSLVGLWYRDDIFVRYFQQQQSKDLVFLLQSQSFLFQEFVELLVRDLEFSVYQSYTRPPINHSNAFYDIVQDIEYMRSGEFYDLEVYDTHNYSAQGIYHHNSGKSAAGAQKALKKIMLGFSGTIINPDFENFKISTWPEFKSWIPWNMVVPQQRYRQVISWEATRPFMLAFLNGAKVYCKGLKNPDSARGANVNWLWYDEAGRDDTGLGWKIAVASVRVGEQTQRWATYTPRTPSHWAHKFFDEQDIPEEVWEILKTIGYDETLKLIDAYHSSSQENKDNLDPMFYASLVTTYHSGFLRTQELEGLEASEDTTLGTRAWLDGKGLNEPPDWACKRLRYWDLAASEKKVKNSRTKTDPDETVGTLLSTSKEKDKFCIEHQEAGQWKWEQIKEVLLATGLKDGPEVPIYIEQEPGSGGINQVAELVDYLKKSGLTAHGHNPKKSGRQGYESEYMVW